MLLFTVCLSIFALLITTAHGQVNFFTRRDVMEGQIFPSQVSVVVGETSYIRIINPVINQSACHYRRPGGILDLAVPTNNPSTSK